MWPAILLAAGCWWGVEHSAEGSAFLAVGALAAGIASAFFLLALAVSRLRSLVAIPALAAIALLGAFLGSRSIRPPLPENHISKFIAPVDENVSEKPSPATFEGLIAEPPRYYPDRVRMVLEAERLRRGGGFTPVSGRAQLTVMRDCPRIHYGDRIMVSMVLKKPENFSNPGGFDYVRYLASEGIFARGSLSSGEGIVVMRQWPPAKPGLMERVERVRSNISAWIERVGAGDPAAEVMRAMIVGDRWAVPDDVNEVFQRAGVSHLLAVSGLHLGLVASIVYFLMLWLLKSSERLMLSIDVRRVAAAATILPIVAYALLAGGRLPTIRAAIMVGTYMLAIALGREKDLPSTIALAAFAILLLWPQSIIDPGFVLSFGAVIAIAFVLPLVREIRKAEEPEVAESLRWRIRSNLFSGAIMSASIILFLSPFVARYFHQANFLSPLTNIIFIPLIGYGVLPAGLAAGAVHIVWPVLGNWLMALDLKALDGAMKLAGFFASLPLSSNLVPTPTFFETLLVMGLTVSAANSFGAAGRLRSAARIGAVAAGLMLVSDMGVWYLLTGARGDLRVTYLDVGEGNAAAAIMPDGRVLLVDTGNSFKTFDAGENILGPYLLHERVRKIDAIAITHSHSDHTGGLEWLLNNFDVGEVWMADVDYAGGGNAEITGPADRAGVPVRRLARESAPFDYGGVRVEVLWPPKGFEARDPNDASLTLRLTYRDASFLFPGDAGKDVHGKMLDGADGGSLTCLLAPHHGASDGITDFLVGRLRPMWVVISSRYSPYRRFPSPDAVAVLERAGIQALRTDKLGAVRFRTDGYRVEISAYDGREMRRIIPSEASR